MKTLIKSTLLSLALLVTMNGQSSTNLKLWYDKPAKQWVEALPLGNGRLGAMVYGIPDKEEIQLNEGTIWAGQPYRNDNKDAKEALPKIRELIFAGKYKEAQDMVNKKVISKNSQGMPYQTAGSLLLAFQGHEKFTNYYRELNLETATATTKYDVDGVTYKREVFSSYPDQVEIVRITASKPGKINFAASMKHPGKVEITTDGKDKLVMSGVTGDCDSIKGAVKFQSLVKVVNDGGSVSADGKNVNVSNANVVTIYISIATSFKNYKDISGNPSEKAAGFLNKALKKNYELIAKEHVKDFQKYFNRVSLNVGETDAVKIPTNQRVEQFAKANDPQLVVLAFQFGRYLLISSSRPGGQAANLQGIWNYQLMPSWDSKYTININTEMNYWPSEITNLSEMKEPLIQLIRELSEAGKQTAKDMYGADGWVAHHNTDIWRMTGPIDGSFWGMWPMGGAWLCQHLYERYEYTGDKKFLKSIYPVMKSSVEFYLSFLVEEPTTKYLVVTPAISPENSPGNHDGSSIAAGTTMDNQILFDLFTKTINTAELLKLDKDFVAKAKATLNRMAPMQVGKWGQLQEWLYDWDNPKDTHRHVSHLYGLYPSSQISPFRTPELFSAAKTSLIARGDESTGWSMGWKVNFWARFLDGNHALKLISDQLTPTARQKGGTYPNLFDAHPPFQIDGNFGFTAGIVEMLSQSYDGNIFVLPALPDNWKNGSVKGIRMRGGFEIEQLEWKDGEISRLVVKSTLGGNLRLRSYSQLKADGKGNLKPTEGENKNPFFQVEKVKEPIIADKSVIKKVELKNTFLYDVETKPGKEYSFSKM